MGVGEASPPPPPKKKKKKERERASSDLPLTSHVLPACVMDRCICWHTPFSANFHLCKSKSLILED